MYELVSVAEGLPLSDEFMVLTRCLHDLPFAP